MCIGFDELISDKFMEIFSHQQFENLQRGCRVVQFRLVRYYLSQRTASCSK